MTRTEADLHDALHELERRADRDGGPSTATLIAHAQRRPHPPARSARARWLPPLAVAAAVATAAVVLAVTTGSNRTTPLPAGGPPSGSPVVTTSAPPSSAAPTSAAPTSAAPTSTAGAILDAAATRLDTAPWATPARNRFYYVRTTDATTWTAVSGTRTGRGVVSNGEPLAVPGCAGGHYTPGSGQAGSCTLAVVPHYRADAPTRPAAWDAYLERLAPGAKAAQAQGKIIVQVLHGDLISPAATAALLRFTAGCPGLRQIPVRPARGQALVGVTCTSMTNGSYGLAFDAGTHALAGFVGVDSAGRQDAPAELVLRTGIVANTTRVP